MASSRLSTNDVFINCPFESEFNPLFRALIFVIFACGFRPRSARELDDGGQASGQNLTDETRQIDDDAAIFGVCGGLLRLVLTTRIEKLYGLIEECRYGIHDLSRTELDNETNLPRFNMPLELGLFLGAKRYGDEAQRDKRLLILDVEQYRYRKFISDLAGMDIHGHGGKPQKAVRETRDWLANVSRRQISSGDKLVRSYEKFVADLPAVAATLEFDPGAIPYVDFERIVVGWLTADPR